MMGQQLRCPNRVTKAMANQIIAVLLDMVRSLLGCSVP